MTTTRTYRVFERGRFDWSAHGIETWGPDQHVCYFSGGSYGRGPAPELPAGCDGANLAYVIDKTPIADSPQFVQQVFRAPLLSDTYEDRPFNSGDGGFLRSSGWASMLAAADTGALNLDQVAMPRYLAYWKQCGARIGQIERDVVRWEDGTTTPITTADH